MNNKQMSKRQRDIKSKLMAAIAMLLVSSIMMVSTTYAWFTLSTAPEVTGITTAVGANGNLEMALQPVDGDSSKITSSSSDGVKVVKEKNITWGNLVDLGAVEGSGTAAHNVYGLDQITLYPSELNVTANTIGANPLKTPTYGADGRVATLVSKTITGVYEGGKFVENAAGTTNGAKGVRAVGISSGMSDRELAYRSAKASASSADTTAKDTAATALRTHGNILADVAISHALKNDGAADNPYYTEEQVAAMRSVLTALVGDSNTKGAFDQIGDALLQYVYADTLATASDAEFASIRDAFTSLTLDSVSGETPFKASYEKMVVTENDAQINLFTKLNNAKSAAETALSKLPAADADGPFAWNQISDALGGLVNVDYLLINNMEVKDVMANPGSVASSIMKNGLKLYMKSGAGVFADIADFCGDYSASINIPELSYGSGADAITVPDVEATMLTQTTANPVYLKKALQTVGAFSGTGASTTKSITEFYGYIIDMAFRTNASGSFLQLQKDGIDRIYNQQGNQGTNPETMGGGAYMQFTTTSQTFTQQAMENLMAAIRIVFFDTDSMAIKGYARLDKDHVAPDTSAGVKMPIIMTDAAGVAKADQKIMELTQNQVHELSVLVYLDGNVVGNDDVATDVTQSMTGKMNLQFSSSATLVPMEYKDLKEGTSSVTPTTPTVPNDAVDVNATINTGYAVAGNKGVYTPSLKTAVVQITETANKTPVTTGTVTINGVNATHQKDGAWSATIETTPNELTVQVTPAT